MTEGGSMRIAVPERYGHDDLAVSLALAVWPLIVHELAPVETRIVDLDQLLGEDGSVEHAFDYMGGY